MIQVSRLWLFALQEMLERDDEVDIEQYFPRAMKEEMKGKNTSNLEEVRIRIGQPVEWIYNNGTCLGVRRIGREDMEEMLNYLTDYSWYAMEEQFKQGFFTLEGGHRIGIAGRTAYEKGANGYQIQSVNDIGAINIRIACEHQGCANQYMPYIRNKNRIYHTLIVSEPGVGKTTFLRDCIRILSGGYDGRESLKVGVVDERSEIAASHRGKMQNNLGPRTDVMDNCPKVQGMKMLLRSMSPEVIAVDELGSYEDFAIVDEIMNSGIGVLGTIHAVSLEEVWEKMRSSRITPGSHFERFIFLKKRGNGKRWVQVLDEDGVVLC